MLINVEQKRVQVRQLFDDDVRLSLHTVAAKVGVHYAIKCHFLQKELNGVP